MENFLSSFNQIKATSGEKHDVLYVNTPWNKMPADKLEKLDVGSLAKDDALIYVWADTMTLASGVDVLRKWGFDFESVYQICDIASYPSVKKETPLLPKKDEMEVAQEPVEGAENKKTETKKTPAKRVKKHRCPPLFPPSHFTKAELGSSRSTTEYLLLGYKGSRDVLETLSNEKAGTLPYQVVFRPELGRKSRSVAKKAVHLDESWVCDRPEEFLDTVQSHLEPGTSVLELFGSTLRSTVDSLGPNIPGGFCTGYTNARGIAGAFNKVLRSMKKVQLQSLTSSLSKMGQADDREVKVSEFKSVAEMWAPLVKSLADLSGDVSYDWGSEDSDLPAEWMRIAVLSFAQKNMTDFGNLRRRKRKRKSPTDAPRALHGIAKPMVVSKELTDFLGLEEGHLISRTHTVRLLNKYIKDNNLQNPQKKKEILPDAALEKLLNPPADFGPILYFRMSSLIGHHFPKSKGSASKKKKKSAEKVSDEASAVDAGADVSGDDSVVEKKQRTD